MVANKQGLPKLTAGFCEIFYFSVVDKELLKKCTFSEYVCMIFYVKMQKMLQICEKLLDYILHMTGQRIKKDFFLSLIKKTRSDVR